MSSKNASENPADQWVDEIMDKEVSDLSDVSPERETWCNKKQWTVSQAENIQYRLQSDGELLSRSVARPNFLHRDQGPNNTFLPLSPCKVSQTRRLRGCFYPPYPYPYQHIWLNSPRWDSGLGNWPVPSVRPSMLPPSISMALVQNRRSSGSTFDAEGDLFLLWWMTLL